MCVEKPAGFVEEPSGAANWQNSNLLHKICRFLHNLDYCLSNEMHFFAGGETCRFCGANFKPAHSQLSKAPPQNLQVSPHTADNSAAVSAAPSGGHAETAFIKLS